MTGAEYFLILQQKYSKDYTGYFNATKANRIVRESIYRSIEAKYDKEDSQKEFDELAPYNKTEQVFGLTNNKIPLSLLVATQATNLVNTITITTLYPHNLIVGDTVTISGGTGLAGINGTFTVTAATTYTFSYVSTGVVGTYNTNTATVSSSKIISDYHHLYAVKCKFLTGVSKAITNVTSANPMVVTASRHNLRTGDMISISGVVGTGTLPTNINTDQIVTVINRDKFSINADGTGGAYTSGGAAELQYYQYATNIRSDEKITVLAPPTPLEPRFEVADKLLKVYPTDKVCSEITIDYMTTLPFEIDLADNVLDLSKYLDDKFLYYIADQVVKDIAGQIKDGELYNVSQQAVIENP